MENLLPRGSAVALPRIPNLMSRLAPRVVVRARARAVNRVKRRRGVDHRNQRVLPLDSCSQPWFDDGPSSISMVGEILTIFHFHLLPFIPAVLFKCFNFFFRLSCFHDALPDEHERTLNIDNYHFLLKSWNNVFFPFLNYICL